MTRRTPFVICLAVIALFAPTIVTSQQDGATRISIPGQIYMDGQPPSDFNISSLQITLTSVAEPSEVALAVKTSIDGTFTISNVAAGKAYKVAVNHPAGYMMQARYGGANPLAPPFLIAEYGVTLQIQVGFAPGRVEALAVDEGKPFANATGVLVPNARERTDLYRTATSDEEGMLVFTNVAPGEYKLFAWEKVQPGSWQNDAVTKGLEDRGKAVRVDKARASYLTVVVIR